MVSLNLTRCRRGSQYCVVVVGLLPGASSLPIADYVEAPLQFGVTTTVHSAEGGYVL